jgi:hypothetical protein
MSKFIKITNLIININYIHSIVIKPNKFCINVASNKFDGSKWSITGFGMGTITSYNSEFEVCKTEHPSDYKKISDWIDNN